MASKPHERVQYFPITRSHLDEWYVKNAALMLDDQLHDKSKLILVVCSQMANEELAKNTGRFGKNKRFWAWKNDPRVLQSLPESEMVNISLSACTTSSHPNHPKTTRWSYNSSRGNELLKQYQ